ncbi:hypothetical protein N7513_011686 [Penicillium frequentans]|nr:hypothetical protein N7513_011686 [Penicillium glabrum]
MPDDSLDVRRCFTRLQNEMTDLRHRIDIFVAEKEGILKDTLALRMRVAKAKENTSLSKSLSDDSDDTADEEFDDDSDNLDDFDDDYSNKDNDHKILVNDDEIPWKISIYPTPGRNLKKLVAWQIERHIQWIDEEFRSQSYDCFWGDKKNFCSVFHIRTVKDLKKGKPFAPGNLGLELAHYFDGESPNVFEGESRDHPWGLPAAALLEAACSHCINPEDWMLLDEPRKLLIAMENWYFLFRGLDQYSLTENARDWTEMQEAEKERWNQAFSGVR